jgi:Helix-turn-helix domain
MSIGGALAEARRQAGLTVAQVAHQTGIRETIIRAIEGDDYSACGGGSYARGYIRIIAVAVGADPEPLIRVYTTAQPGPQPASDDTADPGLQPASDDTADPVTVTSRGKWIRRAWIAVLVVVIGGLWFAAFDYHAGPRHAVTAAPSARAQPVLHNQAPSTPAPARQTPTAATVLPLTPLTPVSATAFGPGGTAQGDDPQGAPLAIAGNPATPWRTDWYATARFGNLQTGTGLLLDMGRPVTIIIAQMTLGSIPGADIELRAGNVPALADLHTVARAANAGGVVQLRPARRVRGRYLLLWFTLLPPDPAGTFQASVSSIRLEGRI